MMMALVLSLSPWAPAATAASELRAEASRAPWAPAVAAASELRVGVSPSPEPADEEPDTDEDALTEAGRAFAEGVQAYKDGRYEDALERFSRAQALAPHPDTLFNVGLAQQRVDQHVAAWRSFDALLLQARSDQEREDIVLAQAASRPHVAWVKVLSDEPGVVCLDGRRMPEGDDGRPTLLTTPGPHRLDVGRQRRTLRLEGGESRTVELVAAQPVAPPPPRKRLRALAGLTIGGGGAAAGLGLAAAFVDDRSARMGLGIGAAAAGTLAITSTVIALAVHRRARRWQPPPAPRECTGPGAETTPG